MVKIKTGRDSQEKLPILKIVQGITVVVVVAYTSLLSLRSTDQPLNIPSANVNAERSILERESFSSRTEIFVEPQSASTSSSAAATTIGYAVSVTGCGSDPLVEGAAVLKHSIHQVSIHGRGRYDYKMYAIYHPEARACSLPLAELGYELLERETPIQVADIEGDFLRSKIEKNGCCGEKELIKLEAYTLTQHPVVVHLDLDVLVLQPLDPLFDAMILGKSASTLQDIKVQWPDKPFPDQVNAFVTRDYNMNQPSSKRIPPVQGGFLVVRPDLDVYNEYVAIIKKGDFQQHGGWGGKVGAFYGGMTIQGLVPYYYDILYPETVVELHHCEWNQMCINPRDKATVNDVVNGQCRTGEEDCPDCRSWPVEQVKTTHYTLCQKPWWCLPHDSDRIQERLCRKLLHEWFRVRSDMEKSWGRSGKGQAPQWTQTDHFFGYCKSSGKGGYLPIEKPYGRPVAAGVTTQA